MNPSTTARTPSVMLFWIGPEGRLLDASERACQALGYVREELLNLVMWDIDSDFPRDRWPDYWRELRQAKTLYFQTTYRGRDGSRTPVEVSAHYLELDSREYHSILAYPLTLQRQTEAALRESEERLALALAVSGQGLYDLDLATNKAIFSAEYARMLGYEPSELELTPAVWASWLHPEERERVLRLYEDCVAGKRSDYQGEFRLRARSGDWIWARSVGRVVQRDAAGRALRLVGTHLDITEQKRTEAALRESEERFAKVFQANPALMCITDIATGRFIDANARLLHKLEYTREQLIGSTSVELGFYADPETRERMIEQLRKDGFVRELPIRFRTRTGKILPTLYSAEILHLGERNVLLSLVYDMTEREQAEEALRTSEAFLDSIIAQSPLPIMIFDATGKIVRLNRATRDLFRFANNNAFDEKVFLERYNLLQDKQLREQGYLPLVGSVFHAGQTVRFQSRYAPAPDRFPPAARPAQRLDLDSTIFPIKDANDRVTHAVAYHLNITELKAAEAKLRHHLDLEQAVAEISTLMIKPDWEDFDARINWTLERIGRLTRADRSYLFVRALDGLTISNIHEWRAPGIPSQIQDARNLPVADYPLLHHLLQHHEMVHIQTANVPDDTALKAILLAGGIHSILCAPVNWGGTVRGFIGFDAVTAERTWREEDIRLLHMVGEIIAHTLQHIESDRALRDNARFLEHLDRISRILPQGEPGTDILTELAAAILEIFRADRVVFLHPCNPDAALCYIAMEASQPAYTGSFTAGGPIIVDDAFRAIFRQALRDAGPVISTVADASQASGIARHRVRSQMAIALRPHGDRPWLLSLHQCAYLRRWTGVEQRLFQAIAERVNDALSGQLLLQQLRESEERYRAIFENAHDAIIVHDDRGAILAANGTMLALYGLTSEEASNLTFLDLSGADNPLEGLDDLWAQALRGGIPRFEWNARRPEDGACFPVEVMLGAIQFGHGNCILANVRDITERKRAEIALQHQERRFRALIENSSDLIALVAPEGTVLYVSPATKQVLGYEPKELLGQSAFAFMRFIRDRFAESMRHPKRPVLVQAEIRHKDGSWRFFEGVFTNCLDEPSIAAIVLNYRDITARKRAEEELRQYREHLEDLVAERTTALQRTNTELRQAMTQLVQAEKLAALGSLVAGVAHELNTPLGNARVVASGLGEHLRTFAAAVDSGALRRSQVAEFLERGREAVELLERNTARAAELIGHFKQVAVDQTSARRRHFGLRQTVEELLATLQPQFKRTAHRVELDIPAEIELDSYPGPLEQVLENLLGNSLVHGFAGRDAGVIRIRAALRAAGDVQIGYSDNGAGVPEKILKRIFDPFFTTKLGSGGSGLGLYIVYNLVTGVLGGTIEVHSAPGAGTTFTLTLPRSAPDRPALEPPV